MATMGKGYGSECHLLRCLGRHRARLDAAVGRVISAEFVRWLDYPFDPTNAWPDGEWKGLDFLPDNEPAKKAWADFWPQRGNAPNWDAVGYVVVDGQDEWLLVEAKAHLKEIRSSCTAKPKGGLRKIRKAMDQTKRVLGVPKDRDWLNRYYQFCNRVAVLQFLASQGVPARLLFIYFTGDKGNERRSCPKNEMEWKPALAAQDAHVGLPAGNPLADRIHKLFLPVCL